VSAAYGDIQSELRPSTPRPSAQRPPAPREMPSEREAPEAEPLILCRECLHPVTRETERLSVDGAHRHTFANPHGVVFEIGCFRRAPGCAYAGASSDEFSWFAGYTWRVALCAACLIHLGWVFQSSGGDRFHGLILDRLIEPA